MVLSKRIGDNQNDPLRRFGTSNRMESCHPWTLAISSLMVLGLLTAILAALAWFVLSSLANRIESRQAEALLAA